MDTSKRRAEADSPRSAPAQRRRLYQVEWVRRKRHRLRGRPFVALCPLPSESLSEKEEEEQVRLLAARQKTGERHRMHAEERDAQSRAWLEANAWRLDGRISKAFKTEAELRRFLAARQKTEEEQEARRRLGEFKDLDRSEEVPRSEEEEGGRRGGQKGPTTKTRRTRP